MAKPPHIVLETTGSFIHQSIPCDTFVGPIAKHVGSGQSSIIIIMIPTCTKKKWKNHFFKMKGDIGMTRISKKEINKEWLLSKATEKYMTPSLYLCFLLAWSMALGLWLPFKYLLADQSVTKI